MLRFAPGGSLTMTREHADLAGHAWPDVPHGPLVLLPVGSTEQHRPHLPLDTGTVIACAVAREAADVLPGRPLVAAALPYGASGEHAHFPGTVSIGHQALHAAPGGGAHAGRTETSLMLPLAPVPSGRSPP
ncbi:MAG: creatininase family protein [Streptomyces sp.]|nr:creatininase family protein [Streptomyces sp.]